ncbi:hypothetical protein [Pseudoxanthomonas dokdonensis]|uniref:Uncharacterized protein n=1 Tax=Pseudoxanthomonas dokdonensis TaxID=344882 RepID=A0A0R0CP25_9GAMM|nr:hypothetical protein [Pseudoxanthomonas dokdonensis]KRG67361.1 hypothetical protein ABB29_15635 [Pseudoxanthomonas dokdonensis]
MSNVAVASASPLPRWVAPLALVFGCTCVAVLWVVLALYLGRQLGWLALLVAADAAWMLRWGGMRPGWPRALLAVVATLLVVALVNWTIVASQLGFMLGLAPWDSAAKLGFDHAWVLSGLANQPRDLIATLVAPVLAAWLAR